MFENTQTESLSLNGVWQVRVGDQTGSIHVPGVWEVQGYSRDEDHAIYHRSFDVPESWHDARVILRFGAVSYRVEVRVNGVGVGQHDGLWSAFALDITDAVHVGASNQLELIIRKPSNRLEGEECSYRHVLVGFIPYISTTFGGPWKEVTLLAVRGGLWESVHVLPDLATGTVIVRASLAYATTTVQARAVITDPNGQIVAVNGGVVAQDRTAETRMHVNHPQGWSPESPALYTLTVAANTPHGEVITQRKFGFRALHADGEQTLLNGAPVFLRGILHWGWYPDRLTPTPSDEMIREEFRKVRALGFNMVKLCLFVPSDNFFRIADEEGMLLWLELPMWWQIMNPHFREVVPREYQNILSQVHHHPSIVIYSLGCELDAHMGDSEFLGMLNQSLRGQTCGVLVCDNSGSGEAYEGLDFDYADFNDYHFYSNLEYFVPLMNHFRRDWRTPRPWIFGEFCAYDDYRDPARLIDAEGQRPWWRDLVGVDASVDRWAYSIQEERMAALGLPFTDPELVAISRAQAMIVRKYTLEQVRLRRAMGGYVITGLRDTPINSAGIFDDHGEAKVHADAFRSVNNAAVLALEVRRARVWRFGDEPAPIDPYNHFGGDPVSVRLVLANNGAPFEGGVLRWSLTTPDGTRHTGGEVPIAAGFNDHHPREVARPAWVFPEVSTAQIWRLEASLDNGIHNTWMLYVYPRALTYPSQCAIYDPSGILQGLETLPAFDFNAPRSRILITSALTPQVIGAIESGARAVLIQQGAGTLPVKQLGFWFEAVNLLMPHPVWERFPHQGHTAMQFYHLAPEYVLDTDRLAGALPQAAHIRPILRRLHARHFKVADYITEMRLGAGQLIASTLRFCGRNGDQVNGLIASPAAQSLLQALIDTIGD